MRLRVVLCVSLLLSLTARASEDALKDCELVKAPQRLNAKCGRLTAQCTLLPKDESKESRDARLKEFEAAHPDLQPTRKAVRDLMGSLKSTQVTFGAPPVVSSLSLIEFGRFAPMMVRCDDQEPDEDSRSCEQVVMALLWKCVLLPRPGQLSGEELQKRREQVRREGGVLDEDGDGLSDYKVSIDSEGNRTHQYFIHGVIEAEVGFAPNGKNILRREYWSGGKIHKQFVSTAAGDVSEDDTDGDGVLDERWTSTWDRDAPEERRHRTTHERLEKDSDGGQAWRVISDQFDNGIIFLPEAF